jgi:hypothetical protein
MSAPAARVWSLAGDFVTSCNCDYFCPCVMSLGRARPTHGQCHGWFAFQIARGRYGDVPLDSLGAAAIVSIPGPMIEGDWTVALYLDERADQPQREALERILTGKAGGPPAWLDMVIARVLGPRAVPIRFETAGRHHTLAIPGILESAVEEELGYDRTSPIRISNSNYWISDEMIPARTPRASYRDHGLNWRLAGTSGEIARFSWRGP